MLKDHSDSERGNLLLPHGLLFPINSKGLFCMHHPTDRITHTTAFVTPVVDHWLEREIAQWIHPLKDRSDDPSHHERTLLPRSYISLLGVGSTWLTGRGSTSLVKAGTVCPQLVEDGMFTAKEENEQRFVAVRRSCRLWRGEGRGLCAGEDATGHR